jgi:hypothetical protein
MVSLCFRTSRGIRRYLIEMVWVNFLLRVGLYYECWKNADDHH